MKRFALLAALFVLASCAQDVGDIDRTQANALKKSDFEGEWFVAQTVTEVPTTNLWTFVGDTSTMERIRWEIQENYLVAYRAYPRIANSQEDSDEYTESPIAAYSIVSHFDIQRSYNASTGEQSNVIIENSSDRLWFERDYMRVDWSTNAITNYELLSYNLGYTDFEYFLSAEQDDADALFEARNEDGELEYFDFVSRMMVEPDPWGCFFTWYGWSAEDCTSAEIKLRTAYLRAEEVREYEPVNYSDRWMTKFGYFRSERFGYDRWRGIRDENRIELVNRHPMWETVWERDSEGNIVEDENGRPLAIPMEDRTPKPIVYYVSQELPEDLYATSQQVADGWDKAFRRAAAAAKGVNADSLGTMFILCHNPVVDGDDENCGEPGLTVRTGDIRYNHLYWVDQLTQAGLLGYGPSGTDPLTGEIIYGAAYVYGAEVDSYAQYATDLIRLANGDLTDEDVQNGQYIIDELRERLRNEPGRPQARSAALRGKSIDRLDQLIPRKADKLRMVKSRGLEEVVGDRTKRQLEKAKQAGLTDFLIDGEVEYMRSRGKYGPHNPPPAEFDEKLDPTQWAHGAALRQRRANMMRAAQKTLYHSAFADDAILGLAMELEGDDYDAIRSTIRAAIYKAVMEHEVGHTIGLRHNFQGSYDSLNYSDNYWQLRQENLIEDPDLDELYTMTQPTQAQIDGKMYQYQYSSIMDYGMRFNSDIQGLGKYDEAAILFAYTSGTYDPAVGVEAGYVEVYENAGGAAAKLRQYADPPSLAFATLLEENHYTTIAQQFDSVEDIATRGIMKYGDIVAERETNPGGVPVEVHYMFCSDEWAGALVSCDVFDSGADPFEIAKNTIDHYRGYYAMNHFRRDNPFLYSEDVLYRMYSRYFTTLTNVYQNWVFSYIYGTDDITMDNYYLFAATAGFNLMADVIGTPQAGGYEQNAAGVWELVDYSTDPGYGLNVEYGVGRNLYTEYDYDSGYYYFDDVSEVGHFWDFLAAVFALTDFETTRLGVDEGADELQYSIPWYLFFEFELTQVFNGVFTQDTAIYSPRNVNGQIVMPKVSTLVTDDGNGGDAYFDPETGAEVPADPQGDPVDLDHSFTQQFYAGLYGMAFFTSNYSLSFPDQMKVFRLGAGESLEPGPDWEVISFTDPTTGIAYAALKPVGEEWDSAAVAMVQRGIDLENTYQTAADPDESDNAYYDLIELIELINLSRSMYDVFGSSF